MANTHINTISSLECYPQFAGETDVVFSIVWSCSGSDGKGHSSSLQQSTKVQWKPGTPYTPFANLTQEQVIGWIPAEAIAAAEAAVDQQIALQADPVAVTPPLPWVA